MLWDLKRAHCQRILGQADDLDEEKRKILDALEFPADCNTEQVTDRMDRLLNQYFSKGISKSLKNWAVISVILRFSGQKAGGNGQAVPCGVSTGKAKPQRRRIPSWAKQESCISG